MSLASPDFQLGPLKLSIDEYQFPNATDYWDANWLIVRAEVDLPGQAWVHAFGPFLMTSELARFRDGMKMIYAQLDGEAELSTLEPELKVVLKSRNNGMIAAEIELTPNKMIQEHKFFADLDQSYLPAAIDQIASILERFPVRGKPG